MGSSSSPIPEKTQHDAHDGEKENTQRDPSDGRNKRKQAPDGNQASSQPPKKILEPRSDVWKVFTRTKDDRDKCTCNYCKKDYSCPTKSGTSNLLKHMTICKQYLASGDGSQHVIDEETGNATSPKVSEAIFKEATDEMIVIGELPLSFVESMAWKHFCSKVQLYKPHSRRTTARNIVEMYVQRKQSMKEWFQAKKQRVSLTTDIWTCQPTGASYMVITCHYIDEYWKLQKLITGFKNVDDHKGTTISNVLLECLADWGYREGLYHYC